jgi:hypothetical protein
MEPLVFKIETQADDSGVRKYEKSISGLDVSSKKASGALKSFAQDIAQARDGADVASATLGAFSRILGSSLAATGVIIAVKTVIDGFSKIDQAVKESEKAVADAFAGMEKAGEALSFAEAVGQAKSFETTAYKIREEIKKINESPMLNIIDGLMQSTDRMRELVKQSEDQAIAIRRAGAESELAHLVRIKGLDAEGKALAANERSLQKELEGIDAIKEASTALAVTQKYAMQADEIRAKFADERGKAEADLGKQRQKDLEDQIKKEQALGEAQQKRFNELYEAEIKSQEQTQKRIDAEIKAEEERAAKRATLVADVATAKEEEGKAVAGAVPSVLKFASGGSGSTSSGRPTSLEVGVAAAGEREFLAGQKEAANALIDKTIAEIKAEKVATGDTTSTGINEARNRLIDEYKAEQKARGEASLGIEGATKSVTKSTSALSDFDASTSKASSKTETFSTNLSDLGTDFDGAMKSADMFSEGLLESSGNMIGDFLKTGDSSSSLGENFDNASESVEDFTGAIEEAVGGVGGGGGAGGGKGKKAQEKGLNDIYKLLDDNLKEMRTYALVK